MKRGEAAAADIRAAIERVVSKGRSPSLRSVADEIRRVRRVGSSLETILPVLREWKREALERASGRIEDAVSAIVALRSKAERDEVRRLVDARTAGGVRVSFQQRGRPRKKGLRDLASSRKTTAK
jgi:hypothetical protein